MPGQYINHFGAIRLRITGQGILLSKLTSLDPAFFQDLADTTMSSATYRFPTVLANFMHQRAKLEISTFNIDEVFLIKEIHIYIKPTFTGYPQ